MLIIYRLVSNSENQRQMVPSAMIEQIQSRKPIRRVGLLFTLNFQPIYRQYNKSFDNKLIISNSLVILFFFDLLLVAWNISYKRISQFH